MAFLGARMLFGFFSMHLIVLVASSQVRGQPFTPAYNQSVAALAFLATLIALLMSLGGREYARAEWDLEWLITLPLSKGQLMAVRVAERALVNSVSWLAVVPLYILLCYTAGASWWMAGPLGILCALPIMFLIAVLQTLIDTGLRVHL